MLPDGTSQLSPFTEISMMARVKRLADSFVVLQIGGASVRLRAKASKMLMAREILGTRRTTALSNRPFAGGVEVSGPDAWERSSHLDSAKAKKERSP